MRRTNQVCKMFRENVFNANNRLNNGVPSSVSLLIKSVSCKIPIVYPKFKEKHEYIAENDSTVFVEMTKDNKDWLAEFAADIVKCGHDDNYVFFNSSLDFVNPGICAFRITKNGSFVQVQVRRIPDYPSLFQLDYFEPEDDKMVLKLVSICDIDTYEKPIVDVVYTAYHDLERSKGYGSVIGTTFQDVMIYLRPWDYSCGSKTVTVEPLNIPCWH